MSVFRLIQTFSARQLEDMEERLGRVQERLNLATGKNERMEEEARDALAALGLSQKAEDAADAARKEKEILSAQIESLIADKKELTSEKDNLQDLSNEQATELEALKLQVVSSLPPLECTCCAFSSTPLVLISSCLYHPYLLRQSLAKPGAHELEPHTLGQLSSFVLRQQSKLHAFHYSAGVSAHVRIVCR